MRSKGLNFSEFISEFDFNHIAYEISGSDAFHYTANRIGRNISSKSSSYGEEGVFQALEKKPGDLEFQDFAALLSPSAEPYLEELAQAARSITLQRFGSTMKLYAPLYLSNECKSSCTYCGFSFENKIHRRTLSINEALAEADILYQQGIRHILLLTGEDYRQTPVEYIGEIAQQLSEKFPSIGIEVYPLKTEDYQRLRTRGVDSLAVYQETYDPEVYRQVHLRGVKKSMKFRMDCPDRAGRAGLRRIAIGALLGLSDPPTDVFFAALHAKHLMKSFWKTEISISLPRLRPAAGFDPVSLIPDRMYVQFLCALRLFLPDVGLTLSTRESTHLRNNLANICITNMSAGSRTEPGGYSGTEATAQFQIEDTRSISEVVEFLKSSGKEPVFIDWTPVMK